MNNLITPFDFMKQSLLQHDQNGPGLSLHQINTLPRSQPQKNHESLCSICHQQINYPHVVRQLPCSHLFHSPCIQKWLLIKNSCPNCQAKPFKSS